MADSPTSSELSEPPYIESEAEDALSTPGPSSRPSVDITNTASHDLDHLAPPAKRRRTNNNHNSTHHSLLDLERAPSTQPDDDNISLSSDSFSSAPGSPSHDEWALREEAQTQCLWRDCAFGEASSNDELVKHVQSTHCATGGPKKTKYICEWGECQKKNSHHPSGYALKAHMRSHTKEKPYYCSLPECDKAFTRSDALAKHMRTVHEPEQAKGAAPLLPDLSISSKAPVPSSVLKPSKPPTNGTAPAAPAHDEDGNPVTPSPATDNITYIPAHHPITGQPGFMIHYPPDVQFTSYESSINADQLMHLLRRQLHWAEQESKELNRECEALEKMRWQEWRNSDVLLDGVMEAEFARGIESGLLDDVPEDVRKEMGDDISAAKQLSWTPSTPPFRRPRQPQQLMKAEDVVMEEEVVTPDEQRDVSPSPPPTGRSGGFDGVKEDPYDNYVEDQMERFQRLREERERERGRERVVGEEGEGE